MSKLKPKKSKKDKSGDKVRKGTSKRDGKRNDQFAPQYASSNLASGGGTSGMPQYSQAPQYSAYNRMPEQQRLTNAALSMERLPASLEAMARNIETSQTNERKQQTARLDAEHRYTIATELSKIQMDNANDKIGELKKRVTSMTSVLDKTRVELDISNRQNQNMMNDAVVKKATDDLADQYAGMRERLKKDLDSERGVLAAEKAEMEELKRQETVARGYAVKDSIIENMSMQGTALLEKVQTLQAELEVKNNELRDVNVEKEMQASEKMIFEETRPLRTENKILRESLADSSMQLAVNRATIESLGRQITGSAKDSTMTIVPQTVDEAMNAASESGFKRPRPENGSPSSQQDDTESDDPNQDPATGEYQV